jgi:hypothetical protein
MSASDPSLNYEGPNADLVNEVIRFALGDDVFGWSGPNGMVGSTTIVSDMRRAVDAAGGAGPVGNIPIERRAMQRLMNMEELSDDYRTLTWHDLKANLVAKLIWRTEWYEWKKQHPAAARTIASVAVRWTADSPLPVYEHLLTRLPEGPRGPDHRRGYYQSYVAETAVSDFMHCAGNRAINGMTDNFWESLFQVYRLGLWPCGWIGTWPAPGGFLAWRRPGDSQ